MGGRDDPDWSQVYRPSEPERPRRKMPPPEDRSGRVLYDPEDEFCQRDAERAREANEKADLRKRKRGSA
jgi:hypothetical protein